MIPYRFLAAWVVLSLTLFTTSDGRRMIKRRPEEQQPAAPDCRSNSECLRKGLPLLRPRSLGGLAAPQKRQAVVSAITCGSFQAVTLSAGSYLFTLSGAKGGDGNIGAAAPLQTGGRGAVLSGRMNLTFPVDFAYYVGCQGATSLATPRGGGGGGGSFFYISGSFGPAILVAGGGGGGGRATSGTTAAGRSAATFLTGGASTSDFGPGPRGGSGANGGSGGIPYTTANGGGGGGAGFRTGGGDTGNLAQSGLGGSTSPNFNAGNFAGGIGQANTAPSGGRGGGGGASFGNGGGGGGFNGGDGGSFGNNVVANQPGGGGGGGGSFVNTDYGIVFQGVQVTATASGDGFCSLVRSP